MKKPQGKRLTGIVRALALTWGLSASIVAQTAEAAGSCPATSVALPVSGVTELEAYEGMLVTFPQVLTVTETYNLGRYGELLLSSGGRLFNPTNGQGGSAEEYALRRIVLDDGSSRQNPTPIPFLSSPGPEATRRVGDTVSGLTGVLTYQFSVYRLYPTVAPAFVSANPRTASPEPLAGGVKVASFNVLNYFTTLNARGANSPAEFARQKAKIVAALKAIDADIVGLIEVENNGTTALQDLVDALNAAYGAPVYAAVPDPATGPGSDAIKVALIYKPAAVSRVGGSLSSPDPIFDRYPVAQTFHKSGDSNHAGSDFTVVINHFKSKGSCPTSGDVDQGQGCWNQKRVEQAHKLLQFIGELQGSSQDPDVLVIGDLNAYGAEDPVQALVAGGLEHLSLRIPAAQRYSFVFDGQSGELDHALATPSLAEQVRGITVWHINSDEPTVLDYNTEFKTDDRYTPTPFRSSDHDPLIIGFDLSSVCAVPPGTPSLELNGSSAMTLECGVDTWVNPGVEALDACYGNVAPTVVTTGYVNGWVPGEYTVRYEVKDSAGNAAPPVMRTVKVVNCPW